MVIYLEEGTYYYGGHAWAAALADGKWVIEDPTNGNFYPMNPANAYAADLQTTWISPAVFEKDGFVLDFHEVHLNVAVGEIARPHSHCAL